MSNTVEVFANTTDNVGVVKVEYYVNNTLKATDAAGPYQYSWDTQAVTPGAYTITAKAFDAAGNVGLSTVSVNVVNDLTPPSISYTAPLPGNILSGLITVSCNAADDVAVTSVEFYVNGAMVAAGNTAPYNYQWDTKTASNGSYTLTAKAYDAAGNMTTSSAVIVTVNNLAPDTTAPTVGIRVHRDNTTINKTLSITATANDNVGVNKVEFYVNGALASTATTAPYIYKFDLTAATNSSYSLTARAYDAAGNIGQTGNIRITTPNCQFR